MDPGQQLKNLATLPLNFLMVFCYFSFQKHMEMIGARDRTGTGASVGNRRRPLWEHPLGHHPSHTDFVDQRRTTQPLGMLFCLTSCYMLFIPHCTEKNCKISVGRLMIFLWGNPVFSKSLRPFARRILYWNVPGAWLLLPAPHRSAWILSNLTAHNCTRTSQWPKNQPESRWKPMIGPKLS